VFEVRNHMIRFVQVWKFGCTHIAFGLGVLFERGHGLCLLYR